MSRTWGVLALVLATWFAGLVVSARPLGFESPLALEEPGAPMPRLDLPPELCERRIATEGCEIREDLTAAENARLQELLREQGAAVERWSRARRRAGLTAGYWRAPWPWLALAWTALGAALAWLAVRR